jgi:hypothetical protein
VAGTKGGCHDRQEHFGRQARQRRHNRAIGDVVKNRVEEIEQESKALREYIRTA